MSPEPGPPTARGGGPRGLPRGVWALGLVSLLMDSSSEMIHGLLPVFLVTELGAGALQLGLIEGTAGAVAALSRVVSGVVSDRLYRRKLPTLVGYGIAAATKPLFALAPSVSWVFGARFLDRLGKGIRGAPRDALVAELTPARDRGAAFGLRQALDTVGAVLGPAVAILWMHAAGGAYRQVFWLAGIPALLAVVTLAFAVSEPPRRLRKPGSVPTVVPWRGVRQLQGRYWGSVAMGCTLALARIGEAFLLLRAYSLGVAPSWTPLVLMGMNLSYAAAAYPLGRVSDRHRRSHVLLAGLAALVLAQLTLAAARGALLLATGVLLWGLHMGSTQGVLSARVADAAPPALRATAFGVFHLAMGASSLAAGAAAGALWEQLGPSRVFGLAAGFAALVLVLGATRLRIPARREIH